MFSVSPFLSLCEPTSLRVDYAYTGMIPEVKREEDDLALKMLSLMDYWSMTDGKRDMQRVMIKLRMVDPFNLDVGMSSYVINSIVAYWLSLVVRTTAVDTQSTELLDYCSTYATNNAQLLQQVQE